MRGTLTGGSVGLLRYPAMLPCFSRLWGMILHCRKSPCRLEITADSRGLASGFSCLGDHPRVCGEHSRVMKSRSNCGGSSPRMRGTPIACRILSAPAGIIPAYAGNTARYRNLRKLYWDHPRVCGEHLTNPWDPMDASGSSPRMRGTPSSSLSSTMSGGIIPAYAGNTLGDGVGDSLGGDHPRVCGEHYSVSLEVRSIAGSSPRMRGTQNQPPGQYDGPGIIPAYAGNTRHAARGLSRSRDHPRVCGEHILCWIRLQWQSGSSPRMRGTLIFRRRLIANHGIIPAYAGNTDVYPTPRMPTWDHPRVCGEHFHCNHLFLLLLGSSPRMRGTHLVQAGTQQGNGIIPAYAGNTTNYGGCRNRNRDHPRVCGEHTLADSRITCAQGSSPRMRGTHFHSPPLVSWFGIIPAYAGNTPLRIRA